MKRLRNTHRSGPGAGTPRTCTVSSSVGTQATGRVVLKHRRRERIGDEEQGDGVDRLGVGEREPTGDLGRARRLAEPEPVVARTEPDREPVEQHR